MCEGMKIERSWNPVCRWVRDVKARFAESFGEEALFDDSAMADYKNRLEYWVEKSGTEEDRQKLQGLKLSQKGDLILFHYEQFSELFKGKEESAYDAFWTAFDGFFMECRSVVIDVRKDELVLVPFRKFRNLNEGDNTPERIQERIRSAKSIEISDKLDGSMQSARFYDGEILMAGSQALDVNQSWRLEDGYRMIHAHAGYEQMLADHPDLTFIFEYISMKDAHVVRYTPDQEGLYLIGYRSVLDGTESSYGQVLAMAEQYRIPSTRVFDKTFDQVVAELDDKTSDEAEGFVINIDGYRIKVKYNDYKRIHGVLNSMRAPKLVLEAIVNGSFDDFLAKLPMAYRLQSEQVYEQIMEYKANVQQRVNAAVREMKQLSDISDRGQVMRWIQSHVEEDIRHYVRMEYLNREYDILANVKYIEISRYLERIEN